MRRAVENHQVILCADLEGLLDAAEPLHGDNGVDGGLQAAGLPVEARALGHVEVGNLNRPVRLGVFPCHKPRQSAFSDAALLGNHTDENCHLEILYSTCIEMLKARNALFRYIVLISLQPSQSK